MRGRAAWQRLSVIAALGSMWVAALVALAAPAYADEAAKTGTMVVTAHSFKNDGGQAVVAIYRRGENWLEPKKAFRLMTVPIKDGKVTLTLKDMPYDTYAISVAHDSNKNGKMDMRWLPYPKPEEGGGVSNNFVRSGKPEYDKAKFDFAKALMSVRITIVYQ